MGCYLLRRMKAPGIESLVEDTARPWAALVGRGDMGKIAAQGAIVEAARGAGLRLGGALQVPVDIDGVLAGYDVVDLATGARRALARVSSEPELCDWGFDAQTFAAVREWVVADDYDLMLMELGILEANGGGHWGAAVAAFGRSSGLVVLTLRPRSLAAIGLRLPDPFAGLELPAEPDELTVFAADIIDRCRS